MVQHTVKSIVLIALTAFGLNSQLWAGESPVELLAQMAHSMKSTSYKGRLVYAHGKRLDSLDIMHRAGGALEQERLVSLNGERYEIFRDGKTVVRMRSDRQFVQVTQNFKNRSLILSLPDGNLKGSKHYRLAAHGDGRIAGLDSKIVSILPLDEYRYGYRIWIANSLKLPLKMELLSPAGELLEVVMFTQIEQVSELDIDKFKPKLDERSLINSKSELVGESGDRSNWHFQDLPDGFAVEGQRAYRMQKHKSPTIHFLVSDGMAVVSVYIEQLKKQKLIAGGTKIGAVNTYGLERGGHQIMVIGEVPGKTVQRIAEAVHKNEVRESRD